MWQVIYLLFGIYGSLIQWICLRRMINSFFTCCLTLISQPAFLVFPFCKVISSHPLSKESLANKYQNSNRAFKKGIGLHLKLNICQILTYIYTLNKFPVNIFLNYSLRNHIISFHCKHIFWCKLPLTWMRQSVSIILLSFCYLGLFNQKKKVGF